MSRTVAVTWHAIFSVAAGVLYFFFVLPRWYELSGDVPPTLGTVLRIVCGALIGLAALPVVFTLMRTRRPELGTPQMALTLRTWSIVLHVLAGLLIIGAAISEIWLSLDDAGRWLFGIYGAAAAIALLGIFAFYLAWVAELPPPPPKPVKVKAPKQRRRGKRSKDAEDTRSSDETSEATADEIAEAEAEDKDEDAGDTKDTTGEDEGADEGEDDAEVKAGADESESASETTEEAEPADGKLRNRRPESARRRRRRLRGGVAVDD